MLNNKHGIHRRPFFSSLEKNTCQQTLVTCLLLSIHPCTIHRECTMEEKGNSVGSQGIRVYGETDIYKSS